MPVSGMINSFARASSGKKYSTLEGDFHSEWNSFAHIFDKRSPALASPKNIANNSNQLPIKQHPF
jgi:hypothetical protein